MTVIERTYLSKDGLKLFYRDYAGPPNTPLTVLCLPGLTRNGRDFSGIAEHLAKTYRVLCADFRGRGKSEYAKDPMTYQPVTYVQDMDALLQSAGVESAAFIGTSLGGLVTMLSASMIRSRVKAAILNDIGPAIEAEGLARIQQYVGKAKNVASWEEAAAAVKSINAIAYPKMDDAGWMAVARKLYAEQPDGTLRADYDPNIAVPFNANGPAPAVDLWPVFAAMAPLPVMVIRGELSDILSSAVVTKMSAAMPSLHTVVVPEVGHAPYLMEPAALTAIDSFLSEVPRRMPG